MQFHPGSSHEAGRPPNRICVKGTLSSSGDGLALRGAMMWKNRAKTGLLQLGATGSVALLFLTVASAQGQTTRHVAAALATGSDRGQIGGGGSAFQLIRGFSDCNTNGVPDEEDILPAIITEIIDATGDGGIGLVDPSGIIVDSAGNAYVVGQTGNNAFKITPAGVITEIINATGDSAGNLLSFPQDIAVDSVGNVYVAGAFSNNVFKITPGGVITEIIDETGDSSGNMLSFPQGIDVDAAGNVYVAGGLSNNAFKVTSAGVITQIIDFSGDGGGNTLFSPQGIAVDVSGDVYVAGQSSHNAFKITAGGTVTQIINATGDGLGNTLNLPFGVAVDTAGNVFITGNGSDNAFKIEPGGAITEIIDLAGDFTGNGLEGPSEVAVDAEGNVFLAGRNSDNAYRIAPNGAITLIIDATGDGGNGLDGPFGIAVDTAGDVYLTGRDSDNAFKITPPGGSLDCNDNMVPDECEADNDGDALINDCDDDDDNDGVFDAQDVAPFNPNICRDTDDDGCDDCAVTGADDSGGDAFNDGADTDSDGVCDLSDNCISEQNPGQEDCQPNGIGDACDLANLTSQDCNTNDIPDSCDIASGFSLDCTGNAIPDECEPDCNNNLVPDSCDILAETSDDCNDNGIPDECDIDVNSTAPGGPYFCTVDCDPDCNNNGIPDMCDIEDCPGLSACGDCNANDIPDGCDISSMLSNDVVQNATGLSGADGFPDECISWLEVAPSQAWSDPLNWARNIVPGDGDPGEVESPTISVAGTIVDLNINASINSLILGVNSTLNISAGTLTLDAPNGFRNEGIFNIEDGFSLTAASITKLTGSQPIRLRGPTATVSSETAGDMLTNRATISGRGIVDAALINDPTGSVVALSGVLQVVGPFSKTNNGQFNASEGGILQVVNANVTGSGSYAANGGMIQVSPGAGSASIAGTAMDIRASGSDAGVVEIVGDASLSLAGALIMADGGAYRGQAGASGSLDADGASITGAGNGAQLHLSDNMSANIVGAVVVDGSAFPCGLLLGCTPPILRVEDSSTLNAASMNVLAGLVQLNGGNIDITGPINIDDGGAVEANSTNPVDSFDAGSLRVEGTILGGRLEFGGVMASNVHGGVSISGCDGTLFGCTPPILRATGTAIVTITGEITLTGSTNVDVAAGPTINLAGDFDNRSIDPTIFDWSNGSLTLNGASQTFELAGENRGVSAAGFLDNFAMGTLRIEPGTVVDFLDSFTNIPGSGCEVLYVNTLSLGSGATIRLNGCVIFYQNLVDEGAMIDPAGGGSLVCFNPGDLNCDGQIDIDDVGEIVSVMLNPASDPEGSAADLNGDGMADGNDIQALVDLLVGT
ncbi:MAG: SBBP repeat-containing protein [Phycisphaerales bacterium]|nr:SBBP repeat-containing protein [Phycisphaerales bacterium]